MRRGRHRPQRVKAFNRHRWSRPLHQIEGAEALLGVRFADSYGAVLSGFNGAGGDAEFPTLGKERGGSIGLTENHLAQH